MPVESRSGTKQVTSVIFAVIAVLVAIGIAWGLLVLASGGDGPVRIQLGDDDFNAGNAVRLSKQIAQEGPVLFSDVSGRGQNRPIYINHFGDDAEQRWVAFPALLADGEPGCFLSWNQERELFEERKVPDGGGPEAGELCSDRTVPPNGEGLEQFAWTIEDERLIINVRGDTEELDPGD